MHMTLRLLAQVKVLGALYLTFATSMRSGEIKNNMDANHLQLYALICATI